MEELKNLQKNYKEILKYFRGDFKKKKKKKVNEEKDF